MSNVRKLRSYQHSLKLIKEICQLTNSPSLTKEFSLKDQIKRASVSVIANLAEGYYRRTSRDRSNFLTISIGSVNEVVALLDVISFAYGIETAMLQEDFEYLGKEIFNLRKQIQQDK